MAECGHAGCSQRRKCRKPYYRQWYLAHREDQIEQAVERNKTHAVRHYITNVMSSARRNTQEKEARLGS